jgi:hypothetical protein
LLGLMLFLNLLTILIPIFHPRVLEERNHNYRKRNKNYPASAHMSMVFTQMDSRVDYITNVRFYYHLSQNDV